MKELQSKSLERVETGIKDEKVVHLLNITAFRQRVLCTIGQNPIDFSFGIYGSTGRFPTPEITTLIPNSNGTLGCRKDFNPNARDFYRRPIVTLAVVRSLDSKLFVPKISDLEELIKIDSQTPFKGVILAECGIRDDNKNVEFLFIKPRENHGTCTTSKMTDEIRRLQKFLPKRKTQEQIQLDLSNAFHISRYITTFDFLTTHNRTLKTNFKFA